MRTFWGVVGAAAGLLLSTAAVVTADSPLPVGIDVDTPLVAADHDAVAGTPPTVPLPTVPLPTVPLPTAPRPTALAPVVSESGPCATAPAAALAPIHVSEADLDALGAGVPIVVAVVINLDDLVELHGALSLADPARPAFYDPGVQEQVQAEVDGRAANVMLVAGLDAERVDNAAVLRPRPVLRAQAFDGRGPTVTTPPVLGAEANLNVRVLHLDELCGLAAAFDVEKVGAYEAAADFGPGGS